MEKQVKSDWKFSASIKYYTNIFDDYFNFMVSIRNFEDKSEVNKWRIMKDSQLDFYFDKNEPYFEINKKNMYQIS